MKTKTNEITRKITKVFKALQKQKIKGKQNFWCCQTCVSYGMKDYENKYDGYVFYHNQDYETLKSDGYTYLSFDGFKDNNPIDIANKIIKAFQKEGIKTIWDKNIGTRIQINFN